LVGSERTAGNARHAVCRKYVAVLRSMWKNGSRYEPDRV